MNPLVRELANDFSIKRFHDELDRMRELVNETAVPGDSSEQEKARLKVEQFLDVQLRSARTREPHEADFLAVIVRRLIELRWWAGQIKASETNARRFRMESESDVDAIYKAAKEVLSALSASGKLPPVKNLEYQRPGHEKDDELVWVLCNKLIHATGLTTEAPLLTQDDGLFKVMAIAVIKYAWLVLTTFHTLQVDATPE